MKSQYVQYVEMRDWDDLVSKTYGRPYSLQQQNGCRDRGTLKITVPGLANDYDADSVSEEEDGDDMGVSFKAWLERDPNQPIKDQKSDWELDLWWSRNFYPDYQMIANDLHDKGLLPAGVYVIDIDW